MQGRRPSASTPEHSIGGAIGARCRERKGIDGKERCSTIAAARHVPVFRWLGYIRRDGQVSRRHQELVLHWLATLDLVALAEKSHTVLERKQ